jgi:dihydrolipoamide dehydrogenase
VKTFDLVVIGSGPGGYRAAVMAALRGLKVAIVEKDVWGGCCLNRGCVPKKTWYHSAQWIAAQRGFAARGIGGKLTADLAAAWRHQREIVGRVRSSYVDYLKRLGVTLVEGTARFESRPALAVGTERLSAGAVIIASGSEPFLPPGLPRIRGRVLTTDDLFDAEPPPGRRVALIGSGVVGTEFAFILKMLGCEVLWLMQHDPLSRSAFSEPARQMLGEALAESGIRPITRNRAVRANAGATGVILRLADGTEREVDWVLLGTGRVPHTSTLALDAAGVETDARGFIRVDEFQRASAPGIYAIGDVANPMMTSNHALADAAVAVNHIAGGGRKRADEAVPQVIYSALELARIGLNEDQAEARGLETAVGFAAFETSPAAQSESDARGYARIVADPDSGRLLGAEIVGAGAGELIHLVGVEFGSIEALRNLASMACNHPARAEEILNAVETLATRWGMGRAVFGERRPNTDPAVRE